MSFIFTGIIREADGIRKGYHWLRCQGWASAIVVWSMQSKPLYLYLLLNAQSDVLTFPLLRLRSVIMQFRIFAMYKKSQSIFIFVMTCFVGEVIAMSSILAFSYKHMDGICLLLYPRTSPI
jgi:hypothetical protein